tara:strand:+ start:12233 stop:12766 length:534 start_codon:yes stop_codon:yes gene_type:complete
MDNLLKNAESIDLDEGEIRDITEGKCNILSYHNLENVSDINDILKNGACIILYETHYNVGHWCALFVNVENNNIIEFFDPYGKAPDTELRYALYNLVNGKPYLTNLLEKSKYEVSYSNERLQTWDKDTNTCGRWCSLRIRLKKLEKMEFVKLFKDNKCYLPDLWATSLTWLYTEKKF